jgi:hypothetical protein
MKRWTWTWALAMGLLGGGEAAAKTTISIPFAPAELWSTTVRFLRVDRGYTIKEKDPDAGYLLFELKEGQRTYKGSLELVPARAGSGRQETQAIVTLPELPRHYEALLSEKLAAKVKEELGVPPPPPRPTPERPKPSPDGGAAR